jgi:hypothetical protein
VILISKAICPNSINDGYLMKYVTMTRGLAKNGWLVLIAVWRGQGQTEAKVYTALKMFWKTALS